jgi:hypothetical protein
VLPTNSIISKVLSEIGSGQIVSSSTDANIVAFAGDIAASTGVAAGAAIVTNIVENQVLAEIVNSTVTAGSYIDVFAANEAQVAGVAAGFSASLSASLNASVVTDLMESSTVAAIGGASTISSGGTIDVKASDTDDVAALTFSLSATLGVGLGGSIVTNDYDDTTSAYVDGTDSSHLANIEQAGQVTVEAYDTVNMSGDATGVDVGGVAVGASMTTTLVDGSLSAYVGDDAKIGENSGMTVGALTVEASFTGDDVSSVYGLAGGIGALSANIATTLVDTQVDAYIGNADVSVSGDVNVLASAAPEAVADAYGVAVGGLAVGASIATAMASPDIDAYAGGDSSTITANNLSITASRVVPNGGYSADANATGSVGGLIGVNATVSTASSDGTVQAYVASGTRLTVINNIDVNAQGGGNQQSVANSDTVGLVAVGGNVSTANNNVSTLSYFGAGVNVTEGTVVGGLTAGTVYYVVLDDLATFDTETGVGGNEITLASNPGIESGDVVTFLQNPQGIGSGANICGLNTGTSYKAEVDSKDPNKISLYAWNSATKAYSTTPVTLTASGTSGTGYFQLQAQNVQKVYLASSYANAAGSNSTPITIPISSIVGGLNSLTPYEVPGATTISFDPSLDVSSNAITVGTNSGLYDGEAVIYKSAAPPAVAITANSTDTSFAKSYSGAGGVVAGEAASADVNSNAITRAYLADVSSASPSGTLNVSSLTINAEHTENFDTLVNTEQASALGFSGAWTINQINSTTEAVIGSYTTINTQNLDVTATNNINKDLVGTGNENVDAGAGGVIEGNSSESETFISNYTHALINNYVTIDETGSVSDPGDFVLLAENNIVATDSVLLDTGGVIDGSGVDDWIKADTNQAYAALGNDDTIATVGDVDLETYDSGVISVAPEVHTYGLAAAASIDGEADMHTQDEVNVGNNTNIMAQGNLNFYAGQTAGGLTNNFVITSFADDLNASAVPIDELTSHGETVQSESINIGTGSTLLSSKDVNLVTQLQGTSDITAYGVGKNWLTEAASGINSALGGNSIPETMQGGDSTQTVSGSVSIGSGSIVEAGVNNNLSLDVSYDSNNNIVVKGNIGYENTTENLGANLEAQYSYLQKLIQVYSADTTICDGYQTQLDYVEAEMTAMGLSTTVNGETIYAGSYAAPFITVDDISMQEGIVNIVGNTFAAGTTFALQNSGTLGVGGTFSSSGQLLSTGGGSITITNSTADDLRINDIDISDEQGGDVTFNGAPLPPGSFIGGVSVGTISVPGSVSGPSISITGSYEQPSPSDPTSPSNQPNPEIDLMGSITDELGAVTVENSNGSINSYGTISAASLTIKTGGNFVQAYTDTLDNVGGDPASNTSPWFTVSEYAAGNTSAALLADGSASISSDGSEGAPGIAGFVYNAENAPPTSSIMSAADVYISAAYLNICGTIQSGQPTQMVTITSTDASEIQSLVADLKSGPVTSAQLNTLHMTLETSGPYNGLYKLTTTSGDTIAAYYDVSTKQIQLDTVNVQGGHVELYGQMASTGNGTINVFDGYGQVTIINNTNYTLVTNMINTGEAAGHLKMTDTSYLSPVTGEPLVTEYYREDGQTYTDSYYEPVAGALPVYLNTDAVDLGSSKSTNYQPEPGLRYVWTTAMATEEETVTTYEDSSWLGAFNYNNATITGGPYTTDLNQEPLLSGEYLEVAGSTTSTTTTSTPAALAEGGSLVNKSTDTGLNAALNGEAEYEYSTNSESSSNWISLNVVDPGHSDDGNLVSYSGMTGTGGTFTDSNGNKYAVSAVSGSMIELVPAAGTSGEPGFTEGESLTYNPTSGNSVKGLSGGSSYKVASNEQDRDWSTSTWYGSTTYYQQTTTESFQTDYAQNSIRADQPINIDFIGADAGSGSVDIQSGGNVILNGNIENAGGTTTVEAGYNSGSAYLNAGASISASKGVTIEGLSIDLQASDGIGASSAIDTSLVASTSGTYGSVTAQSITGNIQIDETTGNLLVGQITTADSSTDTGDITLTAADSILDTNSGSLISGGAVTLDAQTGSIGTLGTGGTANSLGTGDQALNIATNCVETVTQGSAGVNYGTPASSFSTTTGAGTTYSTGQDSFNATAAGDIYISQATGDLYVDSVISKGGDVRLELGTGTVVDVNTNIQQDPRTQQELLLVYSSMNATGSGAVASQNATVSAYEGSVTSDYQTYWTYRNGEYSGDVAGGLAPGQTYYVQVIDGTHIELTTDAAGTSVVSLQAASSSSTAVTNMLYSGGAGTASNTLLFNSTSSEVATSVNYSITGVNGSSNILTFSSDPGLAAGQQVTYISGGSNIAGLTNGQTYYVLSDSSSSVTLSATEGGTAIQIALPSGSSLTGTPELQVANLITVASTSGFTSGEAVTFERILPAYDSSYIATLTAEQLATYTAYYTSEANNSAVTGVSSNTLTFGDDPGFSAGQEVIYNSGNSNIAGLTSGQTYYILSDSASGVTLAATSSSSQAITITLANGATTLTGNPSLQLTGQSLTEYVSGAIQTIENQQTQEYRTLSATVGDVGNSADAVSLYCPISGVSSGNLTLSYNPGLTVGQQVTYASSGSNISGLTNGQTYYVVSDSATSGLSLSATEGGKAIQITLASGSTLTGAAGFTFTGGANIYDPSFSYNASGSTLHQTFGSSAVSGTVITVGANVYATGQEVVYNSGSTSNNSASVAGLTDGAAYYVINLGGGQIELASSAANASHGTAITLGQVTGTTNSLSDADALTANAVWSTNQLEYSVNYNLLDPKDISSTVAATQAPNISAKNVTIVTKSGSIGSNDGSITVNLPLTGDNLTTEQEIELASALPQDLTFYTGTNGTGMVIPLTGGSNALADAGSVVVSLNRGIIVAASGVINITATKGVVDIGSPLNTPINLDEILAGGQVRILGTAGVFNDSTNASNPNIVILDNINTYASPADLVIEGGNNAGIGTSTDPIYISVPTGEVSGEAFGTLTALASDNIYISETAGYNIYAADIASTTGNVYLVATGSILDAFSSNNLYSAPDSTNWDISADNIYLVSGASIGASGTDNALEITSAGAVTATAVGGIYLNAASGDFNATQIKSTSSNGDIWLGTTVGNINIGTIQAGGNVTLNAFVDIQRTSTAGTHVDISGNSITLDSQYGTVGKGLTGEEIIVQTDAADGGTLSGSSYENMFVQQLNHELLLGTITTGTGSVPGEAFISNPGGSIYNGLASGANIISGTTYLFANGNIGTSTDEITSETPSNATTAEVEGQASGSIWLENKGSLTVAAVNGSDTDGMNAGGAVNITADCPEIISNNIVGTSITCTASYDAGVDNSITVTAALLDATAGDITLNAANNVIIGASTAGNTTLEATDGSVWISAAGSFTLNSGSLITASGTVSSSVTINVIGNVTENTNSTISATSGINITASGNASGSAIDIYGTLSSGFNTITGGDYGDTILLQNMTLSGTTTVYSGTGQNSITVDQPASITHGVLNLDGTGGIDSYTVDYTGSNNYLINVNGSPSTMTPVTLTSAGVGTIASAVPSVSFNASTAVNVSNSTLTVTTGSTLYKTGDVVRYDYGTSGSYTTIGGLNNDELYYVVVENNSSGTQTIKLAATLADALEGKTISFTSAGPDSTQYLQPVVASQTIASVSTTANTITFTSNLASFLNGERVVYSDVVGTVTGPAIGGLTSGDTYYVIVVNPTTIELSKSSLTDASTLTINGTSIAAESLLMRANSAGTLGFVADIDSGTNVERVNYTGAISDLIVNTGTGAGDSVTMDDNLTYTVVQGGGGNDSFQVGQVFQSQRDATSANNDDGVGMEDAFTTVSTSQGWLSNGVSYEATILGGTGSDTFTIYHNVGRLDLDGQGGNNTFVVRAFASDSSNTAIHTGNGNNTVEYIANADVSIDGGSGQNTLELIGTEFDDVFVITSTAIYGAGRTVDFTNIQNFIIDGLAGNDQFYILSTSATVTTTLYGGIGSSEFVIGGALPSGLNVDDGSGLPFTVPAGTTYGDLNAMKGTININGGPATAISTTLDNPVMMPGELNYAVIDGTVGAFTEGADGEDDSMTVETSSLVAAAQRLGFTGTTQQLLSDLQGYTVSISTGNAAGWFYQIEGLSLSANQTEVTLTLKEPTDTTQFAKSTPHAGNSFGITSLSSDFFVNENAQVNYLTVYDNKSVDPQNVTLTSDSLTVTDTTTNNTATINYYNTGVLELNLGDYGDTVNITSTMSRSTFDCVTMVNLDSGFTNTGTISNIVDNSVTVALTSSTDGLLAINLEEGHSTVDASASTTGMIIFGGEGDNTILGGLGNDIIFGGEGRVDYYDASGNLITRLGVDLNDQNVLTPSGTANSSSPIDDVPYWQTESSFGGTINVHSVDTNATSGLEGNNNITVGNGNDIIFGGDGSSNIIKVGNGNDVVFGDNGSVQISASGMVSLTSHSAPSGEIATNWSFTSLTMADKGANTGDKIAVGNGANYVFGGDESDTIQVGNGTNYVFGDNGTIDFSGVTVASAATTATDSTVGSNDTINVGNGTNYVFGGYESNAIKAGNGTNYIFGNNGTISFSNGVVVSAATSTTASSIGSDDEITVGLGTNYVFGGNDDDEITVGVSATGSGTNYVFGNNGTINFNGGVVVSAETSSVNSSTGAGDTITVGNGINYVFGGYESDKITVGNGTNYVFGGDGTVSFNSGAVVSAISANSPIGANDTINVGTGTNYVFGGSGTDIINVGISATVTGTNYVFGDTGTVNISGGAVVSATGGQNLIGSNDVITAGNGTNYVFSGYKSDTIEAGNGTNYVFGSLGAVSFRDGVVVSVSTSDSPIGANDGITAGNGTNYIFGGSAANNITAGNGTNFVIGDNGEINFSGTTVLLAETIDSGLGSDDTIKAGNGTNYLLAGFKNNTITAGTGENVLLGDYSAVIFNADGSRNTIYCENSGTGGGSHTLISGAGTDILIGGAGSNTLYSNGGFEIMIGNGGEITYKSTDDLIVQSLEIKLGGSNQLHATGTGNAIMMGGLGPNSFWGGFSDDAMFGQFAYLEIINDRIVTADSWWFGDDVIAKQLSTLSDAQGGESSLSQVTSGTSLGQISVVQAVETQRFNAAVDIRALYGPNDLSLMQQEQSSHPGSYDVPAQTHEQTPAQAPEKTVAPIEEHTETHEQDKGKHADKHHKKHQELHHGNKQNAHPAHSVSSQQGKTIGSIDNNQTHPNQDVLRNSGQGVKSKDLSVALAGLAGWGAMDVDEVKKISGLLSRDGFTRLRSKSDNERFLSYLDHGRSEDDGALDWFPVQSSEDPADINPQQ